MAWIRGLTFIYVIWILIWSGLWLLVGDGVWWMTLLNRVVPQMFAPAPLVILLAIFSRRRKLIAISLIPLLIFGLLFWPYLVPRPAQAESNPDLRVMAYNVLYSNANYDAVANAILTYRPDLVALQEVQPKMMSELVARLDDEYPHSLLGDEHPYGTTAVFSRYPFIDSYVLDLKSDRPAVVAKVDVDGAEITFISAHLLAYGLRWVALPDIPQAVKQRTRDQNCQAHLLIEEVRQQAGAAIVACDCNTKETASSYQILNKSMTNAARVIGWTVGGPTLTNAQQDTDLQHIDYVFYQGPLSPIKVYSIQATGGSDHSPVLAFFSFEE